MKTPSPKMPDERGHLLGGRWASLSRQSALRTGMRAMPLRNRIRLARLEYAATRPETGAMLAITIIAAPAAYLLADVFLLPRWLWIAALLFGLAASVVLILSSLSDPAAGAGHIRDVLAAQFGMPGVRDGNLRQQLAQAIEYRARMENLAGGIRHVSRGALSETIAGIDNWLARISRLALRLDRFHDEASFQSNEKFHLKERIEELKLRIADATDKKVRYQLRETLAGRQHQLRAIDELENLMELGDLRLDHAVSALGTINTQLTIFAARGMDAGDAARLASEIGEETAQVDAVLAAMDRVYEPVADTKTDVADVFDRDASPRDRPS